MAKIQEEVIIITVSKLVKHDGGPVLVNDEQIDALTSVAEELLGAGIVVEVSKA